VPVDPDLIARIRTDLDAFGDVEIAALVNEGYILSDQYLRRFLARSAFDPAGRPVVTGQERAWVPAQGVPIPIASDVKRITRILAVGEHRFLRALMLGAPMTVLFTLCALGVIVWAIYAQGLSWMDLYDGLATVAKELLSWVLPAIEWIELRIFAPVALLVLVVWLVVRSYRVGVQRRFKSVRRRHAHRVRWAATTLKWLIGLRGNLLWIFKGLPIVAVLAVSGVACLSYLFFAIPFLRATREPEGGGPLLRSRR
jgi:hypothetical protein